MFASDAVIKWIGIDNVEWLNYEPYTALSLLLVYFLYPLLLHSFSTCSLRIQKQKQTMQIWQPSQLPKKICVQTFEEVACTKATNRRLILSLLMERVHVENIQSDQLSANPIWGSHINVTYFKGTPQAGTSLRGEIYWKGSRISVWRVLIQQRESMEVELAN